MDLHHLVFNPYQVNSYIVAATNGECAIVDPACCSPKEQEALKKYVDGHGLRPTWLITTHGHFDHIIGNAFVCKTWPVKSAAHKGDLFLIESAYRQGEIFGFPVEQPPVPQILLEDGDTVEIGDDVKLRVLHIPGHSPGSIVLYSPDMKWVITGDVLFNDSIGRSDLPGGDFDQLIDGIRKKLMCLPTDTMAHTGHGPETSIGQEMLHNPYLNGW